MDKRDDKIGRLNILLGVALVSGAAIAISAPPLANSLIWTAPGAEMATLSSQPLSCIEDGPNGPQAQYGRALFNTPLLLGGQAAKAGLNCNSCHISGRDNPHFLMPHLSAGPGTADVTSSFFGEMRGNGQFDPVKIPDLVQPGKIPRDPSSRALEGFIRNLIVEEFSGHEPSAATLSALAAYVRAIRSCDGREARTLEDQLTLISVAVEGAAAMAKAEESSTADLLIAAARHQLGLIDERYAFPQLKRERTMVRNASVSLQTAADLSKWQSDFDANVVPKLRRAEAKSAYNRAVLEQALAQK